MLARLPTLTLWALGFGALAAASLGAGPEPRPQDRAQDRARSADEDLLRALRLLISPREEEAAKGEEILRRAGVAAIPRLREQARTERRQLERVELALERLLRDLAGSAEVPPEPLSREFSAQEFFERRLLHARLHLQAGRYEKARSLAESILALDPGSPLKFALRRVIREARQRLMEQKLEPRIDVGELTYEVGDQPDIRFRLHNRSSQTARVSVAEGVIGELFIDFESRLALGEGRTERRRVPLRLDKSGFLELAPGRFWEHEIDEKLLRGLPLKDFVGRFRFRVTFRPTIWEIEGEDDSNIPLESKPSEFWVVPPGKRALCEDPLLAVRKATLLEREEDFLIAAWACSWASEDDDDLRSKLTEHLVTQLVDFPPRLARVAREVLEATTGRSFRDDVDWVGWWRDEKARAAAGEALYGDLEPVDD